MKKRSIINYILSFFIPIIFMIIICIISNIYPFGDKLINIYDSYIMYPSMIQELVNILKSGSNIFYTWHAGLGTNFYSIINLYIGSPLNLLFLFFKSSDIYLFYVLLIYLKIGLIGLCMYIFLNTKSNKHYINLVFACIYALSTYSVCYAYHIMWTDALYLAPLVLIGIDKLFDKDSNIFYIIILSITILINYYMGYMICIFACIYFTFRIIMYEGNRKHLILKFILSSLLCGMISAVVTIPSAITLAGGRGLPFSSTNYFKFNISDLYSFFYNLLPGSFLVYDNYNDGTAVLASSSLVIVLVIYYFCNKKFSKKEKLTVLGIILFFFLSISFNLLDFAWNMASEPIWWNSRYSYLFILFLIIIAHRCFTNMDGINISKKLSNIILIVCFIVFLVSFSLKINGTRPTDICFYAFFISMIIFTIYYLIVNKNIKHKMIILTVLLSVELLASGVYVFYVNDSSVYEYETYERLSYTDAIEYLESEEKQLAQINDDTFYRIYDFDDAQEDNGMFYGFNSTSLFSSIYNRRVNEFYGTYLNLGSSDNHTLIGSPRIEVLSLLNVKYFLNYSSDLFECNESNACINNYNIPFGILIENGDTIDLEVDDYYGNINRIYSYLVGYDVNFYHETEGTYSYSNMTLDDDGKIHIINEEETIDNTYITYEFTSEFDGILSYNYYYYTTEIYVNDEIYEGTLMGLYINKGDNVKIVASPMYSDEILVNDYDFKFYIMDLSLFESVVDELNTFSSLDVEEDDNYLLKGSITVDTSDMKLFLTIPYDEGLIIKVDGEEIKPTIEFDTFISINLSEGEHTITVEYLPQGLILGASVSTCGIIIFGVYLITNYQKNKKKNKSY